MNTEYTRSVRNPIVALVMRRPRGYMTLLAIPAAHFYGHYRSNREDVVAKLYRDMRVRAGMSLQDIRRKIAT